MIFLFSGVISKIINELGQISWSFIMITVLKVIVIEN
jgi:hypothetical protein